MLASYSFNKEEIGDPIWFLFKGMEKINNKYDYAIEVIDGALAGEIQLVQEIVEAEDDEDDDNVFNLVGYAKKIEYNRKLENGRARRKRYSIDSSYEDCDEFGVVNENNLASYVEQTDNYEKLLDKEDVMYSVSEINRLAKNICIENQIDIHYCMRQALLGIPQAVQAIKNLVEDNEYIGELIYCTLNSGFSFDELFGEVS